MLFRSHAFRLAGWQPDRTETVVVTAPDPKAGAETTLFLWTVPANARGEWIGNAATDPSSGSALALQIRQNFQELDVTGTVPGGVRFSATGRMDGTDINFIGSGANRRITFNGRADENSISGNLTLDQGAPLAVTLKRR